MGLRINKSLIFLMGMIALSSVSGCAQRKTAVMKDDAVQQAVSLPSVRSITVSEDGSRLEIQLDKPVTYTFYKVNEPFKAVIDLAQADFSAIEKSAQINKGIISKYEITKQTFGAGDLVRFEVHLKGDGDFLVKSDDGNKSKLIATFTAKESTQIAAVLPQSPSLNNPEVARVDLEKPVKVESISMPVVREPVPVSTINREDVHQSEKSEPIPSIVPAVTPETKLTDINVSADGITITVDGKLTSYNAFKLSKPERLVVDLFGVKSGLNTNVSRINAFGINQARVGLTQDKLRIVFDTSSGEIPPYHLEKTDSGLKLLIERTEQKGEGQAVKVTAHKSVEGSDGSPVAVNTPATKNQIEALDFKLVDGYSQIIIKSGSNCQVGKVFKTASGLSLNVNGCQIPKNLQRYIDTSAFASVVTGITPVPVKTKKQVEARINVKLRADAPYRIKHDGNTVYWEIKNTEIPSEAERLTAPLATKSVSPTAVKVEEKELGEAVLAKGSTSPGYENKKQYAGRKVTLEFSDADVRKIFQLIAEVSNLNFLIGDDVTGTISIKLVNVPWDQALDVILETKQLAMKRDGNIVQIMQKGKMLTREQEEKNAKEAREMAMPLETIIFDINYAKIDDVDKQFNVIKSKRGLISKDARTNRIIVKDIEPAIADMKFLLKTMDLPERQVMIEARIVEASANFTRDLGVKWNVGYRDGAASFANINSIDAGFGGVVSSVLPTTTTGGLATGVSFGKLTSNVQLDMRLSAAASIGQVKVISTPKVLTLNNKKAKISQGQSVPYQTVSAEGTKTEFVEAVLTLEVTPHITSDGNVGMEVKASNNSVGSGSPPPINKKEATTELVVKNGETTVIGGIYIDSDTENETGVPFLMDIPLLGWMFKSNSKSKNKTELLIFITPKIIN